MINVSCDGMGSKMGSGMGWDGIEATYHILGVVASK